MWQFTYPLVINVTWRLREHHPWTWCRISRLTPPRLLFLIFPYYIHMWFIFICVSRQKNNSMYRCWMSHRLSDVFSHEKTIHTSRGFVIDHLWWLSRWDLLIALRSAALPWKLQHPRDWRSDKYPSVIPDQCTFIAGKNIGNYENINKCRFQWEHVGNYGKI